MKVKHLISFLETIEDKEQNVFIIDEYFDTKLNLQDAIEIKSSNDHIKYPIGVCLISEIL